MRTKRIKLYKFSELSESAKRKAIDDYKYSDYKEYAWQNENFDSMKKFAEVFPITVKDASYGGRGEGVYFTFNESDEIENLQGLRLAKYIWNNYKSDIYKYKYYSICNGIKNCVGLNSKSRYSKIQLTELGCPFTGYYMDNEILAPLFDFMRKPEKNTNFKELLQDCFDAWVKACNNDRDFQDSDEYIKDEIEANEYEFFESGELSSF